MVEADLALRIAPLYGAKMLLGKLRAVDKGAEEGILLQLLHNDRYNQGRAVHAAKNKDHCGDDRQRRH